MVSYLPLLSGIIYTGVSPSTTHTHDKFITFINISAIREKHEFSAAYSHEMIVCNP